MNELQDERRRAPRFPMRLPVFLKTCNGVNYGMSTFSRDVSSTGISFYLDEHIPEGSHLEFIVTLPPEESFKANIRVSYSGKAVRVHRLWNGTYGVAARLQSFEFVGQA
jgi:PilZ domain-containing protein